MKKALVAIAVAAVLFFVFKRFQHGPAPANEAKTSAPLPPPPAENPPVVVAVQSSLRDDASRARIEEALAKGGDANALDKSGRPALILAVRNNDAGAVEALLAKGADPNARDRESWTPLMHAAFQAARDPHFDNVLSQLLAKGADPNAAKEGTTALHIAVNNIDANAKDATVIDLLLRGGAKPDGVPAAGPTSYSEPPIVLAAWNGKTAAALALARGGANAEPAIKTARSHQHPELAAALEKLSKPAAPAKKPVPAPKKKKHHR